MRHTEKSTKTGTPSKQRITFGFGIPIPRPLSYKDLMQNISQIDIGELISVRDTLCATLPQEQRVAGVYRDLETMLLTLSKFYLETDPIRKESEKLVWFGEKGAFKVAVGGDSAPFGKWVESVSWLVSFLNVGARVASPNENFLLFGANCEEDYPAVRLFTKQLASRIKEIEKKAYTVSGVQVTFSFELVPSDMKFLCFLKGELNNSASYFSSFANVSKADCTTLNGKFGNMPNCKWKPRPYRQRLDMAKQVSKFKDKISPQPCKVHPEK